MSIDSPAGCDICRRQFTEGSYPPVVLDRFDEQRRLYRCGTCGTCWEETERYVVPVDESYVRAEYPEVRDLTTLLEEYIRLTEPSERDLARLITQLVQSPVVVPLSAPYASPGDPFLPVYFSRGGDDRVIVFSSLDRMSPVLKVTAPAIARMSGLAVLRLVRPGVGLVVNPDSADEFELPPNVVVIALDAAAEDESEVTAGQISVADLESWAGDARYSPLPQAMMPGDLMLLSDMELTISIARRDGNHVVETTSRGGPRRLLGSFRTESDALRLVAYWIGSGFGQDPGANTDLVGATLEEGPISTHLSWPGGSAEFGPGISGRLEAKRFNWARGRTLEAIANDLGRPLRK